MVARDGFLEAGQLNQRQADDRYFARPLGRLQLQAGRSDRGPELVGHICAEATLTRQRVVHPI